MSTNHSSMLINQTYKSIFMFFLFGHFGINCRWKGKLYLIRIYKIAHLRALNCFDLKIVLSSKKQKMNLENLSNIPTNKTEPNPLKKGTPPLLASSLPTPNPFKRFKDAAGMNKENCMEINSIIDIKLSKSEIISQVDVSEEKE